MATLAKTSPLAALMTLALLVPSTARAQDQRFRASFAPAAATISDDAELALGGTFGYRASKHLWFEGDLTWIDAAAGGLRNRNVSFGEFATSLASYTDIVGGGPVRFGGGTLPVALVSPTFLDCPLCRSCLAAASVNCGPRPTDRRSSARWVCGGRFPSRRSGSGHTSQAESD